MTTEKYEDWTSCEEHGHTYEDGRCTDCGESNGETESHD